MSGPLGQTRVKNCSSLDRDERQYEHALRYFTYRVSQKLPLSLLESGFLVTTTSDVLFVLNLGTALEGLRTVPCLGGVHTSVGAEKYNHLLLIPRLVWEVECTCVGGSRAAIVIVK